ncbi:MAG: T9SS type A sorting domain-containing protein [Saprospiraceae bacterium]
MKFNILFSSLFLLSFISYSQPSKFYPRGIGGGGALFFPTINPADDNEFYVSCDLSALFHSKDFGKSYDQIDFTKVQAFNTSTYEFTNNPMIAYCNFNDGNEGYPVKTTDGGKTWNKINGYNLGTYGSVYTMKANYNNPQQIIIGAYGDILISNNGGANFTLVKHTANIGAGIIVGGIFWDDTKIFIGTNEGLLYSNNSGMNFSTLNTSGFQAGNVIWSFAGGKQAGNTKFVCITSNVQDTYNGIMPWDYNGFGKGVYTMDNANGIWKNSSTGINFSNDYVMYAAMANNDINTIYLGGNDNSLGAPLVLKSIDGGKNWTKSFNTSNNANIITAWEGFQGDKNWGWSETCFGITVAPNNVNKLMFTSYSNVEVSSDAGNSWRQAYVNTTDEHPASSSTPKNRAYHSIGLENTTCWQIFWDDAKTMMSCYSDIGGIRSVDSGQTWGFQYSGFSVNSLYRMTKGLNGNLYGACSNIHDMYQSTRLADAQLDANDGNGKIVYSTDHGANWSILHQFNHPVFWVETDPNNQNRMYASVIHFGGSQGNQQGGIYRTDDLNKLSSSNWVKLPNPPRTEGHPACLKVLKDGKLVCSFSGRRTSSGVFTASSGIFLFDPNSNSWQDLSFKDMNYWTKDIVIDLNDASENTWYVAVFSGWGGAPNGLGGLYKTSNRGQNWIKLTGSQFDRVTSITFNPQNKNQAYLTTENQGLWLSNNMDQAIPAWNLVNSYPYRQPERVFFNPFNENEVWISSFGNGMKVGNLNITNIENEKLNFSNTTKTLPNPNSGDFEFSFVYNQVEKVRIEIYNSLGALIYSKAIITQSGENKIPISIKNRSKGEYFLQLLGSNQITSTKFLIE